MYGSRFIVFWGIKLTIDFFSFKEESINRLGDVNNMNLLSYRLETGSLMIKALASLFSSKSLAAGGCLSEFSLAFLDLCITGVSYLFL